jgi:hypothetical protein
MPDQHCVLQIERLHQFGKIVGVSVHVVAVPRLTGPTVPTAIMRDAAEALTGQEEHLIFKGVGVEAIGVIENNGLTFTPFF